MKAVFIPNALYSEFLIRSESMLKFLSLSSLAATLSPQDVAFYIRCNQLPELCVPDEVARSFEFINFAKDIDHLLNGGLNIAIQERLNKFTQNGIGSELKDDKEKMLTCDILEGDVICFTYIDAPDNASQGPDVVDFYDRLLTQVTALQPFSECAKLPIFGAYLKAKQEELFTTKSE